MHYMKFLPVRYEYYADNDEWNFAAVVKDLNMKEQYLLTFSDTAYSF